jgi:sulfotransferase
MTSFNQFVCLSGLPRAGSTLLSAILSQNPLIHSEGNSAVCQLMWDMEKSFINNCGEQINANNRQSTINDLISNIPYIYYKNNDKNEKIVVDKCRSWTLSENVTLLKKYIDSNIKIIILERPLLEVVNSFVKIYNKNNKIIDIERLLDYNTEPIMRSFEGIVNAKKNNQDNKFLFITYKELITDTQTTLKKIYDFCNWTYFEHNLKNIVPKYKENDTVYNLNGFHDVHPEITKPDYNINLPLNIIHKCLLIQENFNLKIN